MTGINQKDGSIGQSIRYLIEDKPYGKIIVVIDRTIENNTLHRVLFLSIGIAIGSLILIFVIVYLLSIWAIKPVKDAFIKQKQFVADASHKLKTPLAIMNTNIDVLLENDKEYKWLNYMQEEIKRMSGLVNSLLYLARVDSIEKQAFYTEFNLSDTIECIYLPFESLIYEKQKSFQLDLEPNIYMKGDENKLNKL